jgi:hypothetical protein
MKVLLQHLFVQAILAAAEVEAKICDEADAMRIHSEARMWTASN